MPIWLRKFTFEKLKEHYNQKKEAEENAYQDAKRKSKVRTPAYNTKVRK